MGLRSQLKAIKLFNTMGETILAILQPVMVEVKKIVKESINEVMAEREAARRPGKLLNRKQTAEMIDVSLVTLWNLANSGKLTPVKIGRSVKYREEDVKAYLESARK